MTMFKGRKRIFTEEPGNDTAVLLEQVPTDTVLNFGQCVFEHNETDLDNRCSQPVDLSEAEFR